ncbi:ribonuclease HII [Azospirillum sp. TSO22-1]|uniref:ribonuclease HII n=1 Tax=Azospirillum sp. TSO22-1 TaxID=716789 RepID=UPI000D605F90|nr:ribonuclease HII [Azospirillum sp. TSO22-1]PWC56419.1 ribonuclease HII [Azospirillum sp. TSO22-1]
MNRPDLALETACGPDAVVCGVDEVGRGPLAGPVMAAAVVLPPAGLPEAVAGRIHDSKKLTARAREDLAPLIREHALAVCVAEASVAEIDAINILQAALLAMRRAVEGLGVSPTHALVDGNKAPKLACTVRTVVKGDSTSLSIAAASIVAKVERDRIMTELHAQFPDFAWDRNAGYPSAAHLAALKRLGATPHHRTTFGPVSQVLALRR